MTMATRPRADTARLQTVRDARTALIRSNFTVAANTNDAARARIHENAAETLRALDDPDAFGIPMGTAEELADSYCAAIYLRQQIAGSRQCGQWHALMSAARRHLAEFGTSTWRHGSGRMN